ncbi:MAG: hypothetical protein HYU54_05100 [Actinobacteria bacterium]|nr:hypothetical protein [Actinomycetota bacterium]
MTVRGGLEAIITGDRDLLELGSHAGIAILTPAQLVDRLGGGEPPG